MTNTPKEPDKGTEGKILAAAKAVFLRKGADGARMQEIADEAGINKALLHYYFRSKDKLFYAVFAEAFQEFFPKVALMMATPAPLSEKIPLFVESYVDLLLKNPHLPIFILHELARNPERILSLIGSHGISPTQLISQIHEEAELGLIRFYPPEQLLVNIISMIIFPFAGRPIVQGIIFANDEQAYDAFLRERADAVTRFISNALKP
jgi:AcrR family transcriptional regulator